MIHILKTFKKLKIIVFFFIFNVALNISFSSTVFLTIEFSKGDGAKLIDYEFSLRDFETFFTNKGYGNYVIKILDMNNNVIYEEKFDVLFIFYKRFENYTQIIETEKVNKTFRLFLTPSAYYINFYRDDKKILTIELTKIICNFNGICENERGENEYYCPEECKKFEKTKCLNIKDNICQEDCPEDPDCQITYFPRYLILLIIILAIIISIFLFFILQKKGIILVKKKETLKSLKL